MNDYKVMEAAERIWSGRARQGWRDLSESVDVGSRLVGRKSDIRTELEGVGGLVEGSGDGTQTGQGTRIDRDIRSVTSMSSVMLAFANPDDALEAAEALADLGFEDASDYMLRTWDGEYTLELSGVMRQQAGNETFKEVVDWLRETYDVELVTESTKGKDNLVEFNPYHDAKGKFFAGKSTPGSWSVPGKKKRKLVKGKKGGVALKFTAPVCGRDARKKGEDIRCQDGQRMTDRSRMVQAFKGRKRKLEAFVEELRSLLNEGTDKAIEGRIRSLLDR